MSVYADDIAVEGWRVFAGAAEEVSLFAKLECCAGSVIIGEIRRPGGEMRSVAQKLGIAERGE